MGRRTQWLTVSAVCAAMLSAGCTPKQKPAVEEEEHSRKTGNPLEIKPSPTLLRDLKVGGLRSETVAGSLRVGGRVQANERRLARVGSPVTGRITELLAFEGQHVKAGQILARIHSTQLSDAQFAFLKAQSQTELARRATARAQQLLDAGVIGSAELQRRQAELDQATAEVSSERSELQMLGMSPEAIDTLQSKRALTSEFLMLAAINGTVLERKVTIGQIVQPAEVAFLLADLSSVWLVAEVPEQSAGHLQQGKIVQADIAALPGHTINGRLTFVSSIVNPQTGTVTARMDLANPQGLYKPDMLATLVLKDNPTTEQLVPLTAVVREEDKDFVFVAKNSNVFALQRVTLGEQFGEFRVLKGGLDPNVRFVLDGAFHLNNERKRLLVEGGV